jgi:hypothetical protein
MLSHENMKYLFCVHSTIWLSPKQCPSREVPTEVDVDMDDELDVPEAMRQ